MWMGETDLRIFFCSAWVVQVPVVQTSGCFMKATFFYLCKFLCLNCNLDLTFSVIDGSELGSVQFTGPGTFFM